MAIRKIAPPEHDLATVAAARLGGIAQPEVAVVVPVHGKWDVTRRGLLALLWTDLEVALQVIVVDDASPDDTAYALASIPGIDVVRNGTNVGFVGSCNRGAQLARAPYVWFLNNDTETRPGALRSLLDRAMADPSIGIVGSKLVYPNGLLQEAGGIIWRDASGWNFGRGQHPARHDFNFARDVDYVSGASLLIARELFGRIGGFDTRFAPAYYEDTDLCFAVRSIGKRVVYEPRSVVVHHEGLTSGTDITSGAKRFQERNRPLFREKWAAVLDASHLEGDASNVPRAARRLSGAPSVLFVDSYVPRWDREAGSNRLHRLMLGLRERGYNVVMFPDNGAGEEPYTSSLEGTGIEVVRPTDGDGRDYAHLLGDVLTAVNAVWICRPELMERYEPVVRAVSDVPIVYDTVDLHHLRMRREAELRGDGDTTWKAMQTREFAMARAADLTVVVAEYERALLREHGISDVAVIGTIHDIVCGPRSPESTEGVLFIGGYNHIPNRDGVKWLVEEIMPLVWAELGEVPVTLLGSDPPPQVRELASNFVHVPGYIQDVGPYFQSARVFVAPIRFGAGLKGKVGQALEHRLPIVSTPTAIEGFGVVPGSEALVAETTADFASAIVRLYSDRALWTAMSAAAERPLRAFSTRTTINATLATFQRLLGDAARSAV